MSIAPIPPIVPPTVPITAPAPTSGAATGADGTSFADSIGGALDSLADAHNEVDQLAIQAATGDLRAVHDFTIAASEAQLMTELTVEVRNRAVEAFNDIMRMQV